MRRAAALLLFAASCHRRAPIGACDDDLTGAYATPTGRWMILDSGTTLEAYTLFDDAVADGAPRLVDLARDDGRLGGEIKRRYMRRADECWARAPFHVTACKDDALQVVVGEVAAPLTFSPCTWAQAAPTHVETWRHE